ncbi:MAG: hypothetical protein IJM58_01250 [Muribaculaceae bacterium]|nr:hypothetical protein [Muribaculaceae bacterium]
MRKITYREYKQCQRLWFEPIANAYAARTPDGFFFFVPVSVENAIAKRPHWNSTVVMMVPEEGPNMLEAQLTTW